MRGLIFFIVFVLGACNPQQRLLRLQKNHPYLFDTTTRTDSFFIRTSKVDTFTNFKHSRDTITFKTDSLTIQRIYYRDSFFIHYKSRPCTTFRETKIIQNKPITVSPPWEKYLYIFLGIFVLLLLWKILR